MTSTTLKPSRRWFAEPMVWLVLALPASAVLAGIVTAVIAWRDADGTVADDTYRKGLAIGEQMARSEAAKQLGLVAMIDGALDDGAPIAVRLEADAPLPAEAVLELRLVHPGRRDADRVARLARVGVWPDGRSADFTGTLVAGSPAGPHTAWRIVLAGRHWRLDGTMRAEPNGDTGEANPALRWRLRQ
jgi:hypothetical protein